MVLLRKRGEVANNGLRSGLGNHDVQTHRLPEEARCSIGHLITQRQKAFQQRSAQEPRSDPLTETPGACITESLRRSPAAESSATCHLTTLPGSSDIGQRFEAKGGGQLFGAVVPAWLAKHRYPTP
jgi:hypothetical protein